MSTFGAWLLSSEKIYKKINAYDIEELKGVHETEPFAGALEAINMRASKLRVENERVKEALVQAIQEHPGPAQSAVSWVCS